MNGWTRRRFVTGTLAAGGWVLTGCQGDDSSGDDAAPTTAAPTTEPPTTLAPIDHGPPIGEDPFGLGVASGDPDASSVVLWTWVAGGPRTATVEVALDDHFTRIVHRSDLETTPDTGGTGRVIVTGLHADTTYHYRFVADGHIRTGRTRTAPAADALPAEPLRIAQLSCMRKSSGYWSALTDVADAAPDLVVHCGDYVYESDIGTVRPDDTPPPETLDEYRELWRRYKIEPELQAAHAAAPWLMVWDDHEVENNYQGVDPGDPPDGDAFIAQRAAAYRAWWEYTPTRLDPPQTGAVNFDIHRTVEWGALTRFVLLDTRQYRDDQPCPDDIATDVGPRCETTDTVTMLGPEQEAWFEGAATGHDAVWTTVVQQVVVHQWRLLGGNLMWNLDQWDGYTGARRRLLEVLERAPSPVVFSGDVHSSWVADLPIDFDQDGESVAVEFVGPGVSSDLHPQLRGVDHLILRSSPYVRWAETTRRGWVLHTVTADEWRASYRLVDDAIVPDSAVRAVESFTVRPGDRRIRA